MKSKYLLLATLFCSSFTKADEEPIQINNNTSFYKAVYRVNRGERDAIWLDQSLNSEHSPYSVDANDLRFYLLHYLPYESELIKHTLEHHNFKNKNLTFSCMSATRLSPRHASSNTENHQEYQNGIFPLETLKVVLSFVTSPNGYEEIIDLINTSHFSRKQKDLAVALIQKRCKELEMIEIHKQQALRNAEHNAATYKRLSRLFPEN